MLYNLFAEYSNQGGILNLFRYLTFRSGGAILTAMLLSFFFTPHVIRILKRLQKEGQPIRQDGPKEHLITKKGIPTMGGVMILLCIMGRFIQYLCVDCASNGNIFWGHRLLR